MRLAALLLTLVCQGGYGCPPGYPIYGVVADGYDSCTEMILPSGPSGDCQLLGGVVPLGDLFAFPVVWPGECVILAFEEAA